MVKTIRENKVQYVAPRVNEFEVKAQKVICGSLDGLDDFDEEEVQDNSARWRY